MSSSAIASFSSSSANKGSNNITQSYDELNSDFFDQFLTFDNTVADHESPDYSILPTHFDDVSIDGGLSGAASSSFLDEELKGKANVQGEPDAMLDNAASSNTDLGSYFYAEVSGRAAVSDPELLSLGNITLDSPQIPQQPRSSPSSPSTNMGPFLLRKNRITDSITKTLRRATESIDKTLLRSPIKKSKSSKMLRTHHSNHSQDFWERKLSQDSAKLGFDLDHTLPLSPPPSAQISNASESSISSERQENPLGIFTPKMSLPQTTPNLGYDTPMATPTLEQHQTPRRNYQVASSSPFPVTPRGHKASGSWSQMPPSGNFQHYSNTHFFPEMDDPVWWNHAATAPMAQPSPSGYHTNPQRATKSLVAMQLQNDLNFAVNDMAFDSLNMGSGLMIQMPGASPTQHSFGMGARGSPTQQQGYFSSGQPGPRYHHRGDRQQFLARRRQSHSYPHPHPHSHHGYSLSSSHPSHPLPHSRPPPLRKYRSHTMHRSHSQQYNNNHNSDSDSPCPSPSIQVRKRKSAKSKSSKNGGGTVDFVNYTPSDSRKILTGVAPSGSSKTKARREKEALEKRRKLSQAAVRAVRAAGGDVESLVEQGLLV